MLYDLPDLAVLARDLAEGRIRALELAERALQASRLGAYRTQDPDLTRSQARAADRALATGVRARPWFGIPTSVKDLYGAPGWPTFAGTPARLPDFEQAGPLLQRIIDQHAVITGKTHTVELAFGGIGTNPHAGTPINPWDAEQHRVPGGSSAGAGVSLLEGSALVAFGTDTAGSVRIPAAWTGCVGLKTTAGRWPTGGIVPLSTTLDTAGVLTRTVADAAWAFAALEGGPIPHPADLDALRVGRAPAAMWADCSPGVAEAVEHALKELPFTVEDAPLPAVEALELFGVGGPVSAELDGFLSHEAPGVRDTLDPNVASRVASAGDLTVREYLRRRHALRALAHRARASFDHIDVFVSPTVANRPPTVADVADPDAYRTQNLLCLRNTAVVSYLGLCALSLPCGLDKAGMPVGLHVIGPAHQERRLLSIGLAIEARIGRATARIGRPPR